MLANHLSDRRAATVAARPLHKIKKGHLIVFQSVLRVFGLVPWKAGDSSVFPLCGVDIRFRLVCLSSVGVACLYRRDKQDVEGVLTHRAREGRMGAFLFCGRFDQADVWAWNVV
jgi:hypothetical protein